MANPHGRWFNAGGRVTRQSLCKQANRTIVAVAAVYFFGSTIVNQTAGGSLAVLSTSGGPTRVTSASLTVAAPAYVTTFGDSLTVGAPGFSVRNVSASLTVNLGASTFGRARWPNAGGRITRQSLSQQYNRNIIAPAILYFFGSGIGSSASQANASLVVAALASQQVPASLTVNSTVAATTQPASASLTVAATAKKSSASALTTAAIVGQTAGGTLFIVTPVQTVTTISSGATLQVVSTSKLATSGSLTIQTLGALNPTLYVMSGFPQEPYIFSEQNQP